jgi:formamidopyrimidine-DNA glycosylase
VPELPEVETTKNGLYSQVKGNVITKVNLRFPRLRYPIPSEITQLLPQQKVLDIIRRGKYLIFIFANTNLIIHLGMSGKIKLVNHNEDYQKHDHFELVFQDFAIRLNDPRRFGCVLLADNYKEHKLIKSLGVEPLTTELDAKYLLNKAKTKKCNIKAFLMDSKIVVGVGNIYACESLFLAKINPKTPVNALNHKQFEILVNFIKQVLTTAIKSGGTTLQDFKGVDGELGYFALKLKVYGRENLDCVVCGTKIKKITQNQRSTFYCPSCQK